MDGTNVEALLQPKRHDSIDLSGIEYFTVTHSVDPKFSPPKGYKDIFFTLDKGLTFKGIRVPADERGLADDIMVMGMIGYGDTPNDGIWPHIAEEFRQQGIKAVFSIHANHFPSPELRAATHERHPHTKDWSDAVLFDRDGIHRTEARRGVKTYTSEFVTGRNLYAKLTGRNPHAQPIQFIGHSLGGIGVLMKAAELEHRKPGSVAGVITFGLVAGFAQRAGDGQKPGFLGKILDAASHIPEEAAAGITGLHRIQRGDPILAPKVQPPMWFDPDFTRDYIDWNLLQIAKDHPHHFKHIEKRITTLRTSTFDGMAPTENILEWHAKHPEAKQIVIEDTDHFFMTCRNNGPKGNQNALPHTMQAIRDTVATNRRATQQSPSYARIGYGS